MKTLVQNSSLYYQDHGDHSKTPIIFLHAFPLNSTMWDDQVNFFKNDYRVITFDFRGLGQSDVGTGQYTIDFFADDLVVLMDHLKIDKAVWCGLSMGGYTILRAIEKYPDRCKALILCNTKSVADNNAGKLGRSQGIQTIQEKGLNAFAEHFLTLLFKPQDIKDDKPIVKTAKSMILSQSSIGVCGNLLALGLRTDTTENLKNIKVPTQIIASEFDVPCPKEVVSILHENIPESQLSTFPGIAHMSNLEVPDEFNRVIGNFLKERVG